MRLRALALALLPVAAPALAQSSRVALSGVALAYQTQYRLRYAGVLHDQTGTWLGGEGALRLGPVVLRASGLVGKLSGDTSIVNPDRTLRITTLGLGLRPASWLELGADVMARRVESGPTTLLWRLVGGHVGIALPLGLRGLTGTAVGTYYPASSVTGGAKLNVALSGELGVSYAPPRSVVVLRLAYRFERYDFAPTGTDPARLEQLRALVAGLGIRVGK